MGFARLAESSIRKARGVPEGERLGNLDRIAASTIGGALGCWNQPIEVVRVEVSPIIVPKSSYSRISYPQMQSMAKNTSVNRPAKLTVFNTLGYIYKESGIKGLYRGVTPRIGLGIWQTVRIVLLSTPTCTDAGSIAGVHGLVCRSRKSRSVTSIKWETDKLVSQAKEWLAGTK